MSLVSYLKVSFLSFLRWNGYQIYITAKNMDWNVENKSSPMEGEHIISIDTLEIAYHAIPHISAHSSGQNSNWTRFEVWTLHRVIIFANWSVCNWVYILENVSNLTIVERIIYELWWKVLIYDTPLRPHLLMCL